MAETTLQKQKEKAIIQIANVSRLLRDAIQAALPVAPEQYLTVTIPGTSIDIRDITEGGTYVYGKEYSAFVPPEVRQAEARLVDGLMPLAHVALGITGKSVSRSYSRALDTLVARVADIKTGGNALRSPGEETYKSSMAYLTKIDPQTGMTPVEVYIEKQARWASAQSTWDKAKLAAQASAKAEFPDDLVKQRQTYDEWSQANFRKYKFAVQGHYMNWVTNGMKYSVEQNFGVVDIDSIMARIELSKESLRNSTLVDADGANELAGVVLEPKDWATKCRMKALGWYERNRDWSLDQIDAEISRLERLKASYAALKVKVINGKYPVSDSTAPTNTLSVESTNLETAYEAIYDKEAALNKQNQLVRAEPDKAKRDELMASAAYTDAVKALNAARRDLQSAIDVYTTAKAEWTKYAVTALDEAGKTRMQTWIDGQSTIIDGQIAKLQAKRDQKAGQQGPGIPVIEGAEVDSDSNGTIVAQKGAELADPVFLKDPTATTATTTAEADTPSSDPWTEISVSFSAEDQSSTTNTSSWGMSVGGGGGWGLWSVGGNYAHDESKSDTVSDMAKCNVSVTFSALVVNINRPWLYGELFTDDELDVATGISLSPGAEKLHELMISQKSTDSVLGSNRAAVNELAKYSMFPAYPTSFILAADTVVEFQGDTQHIENHFSAQANSGSFSVGWGPWSVSSSFHQASSSSNFQMQSTATGCRLSFGAPQIIGWVSQILPALPRDPNYAPMVQNTVDG